MTARLVARAPATAHWWPADPRPSDGGLMAGRPAPQRQPAARPLRTGALPADSAAALASGLAKKQELYKYTDP